MTTKGFLLRIHFGNYNRRPCRINRINGCWGNVPPKFELGFIPASEEEAPFLIENWIYLIPEYKKVGEIISFDRPGKRAEDPVYLSAEKKISKPRFNPILEGQMNVSEAIRTKRAIRKFSEKPLPDDMTKAILNAGRRSQSSKNEQAWQFIAIRDKHVLKELSLCGEWAGHLAGAALAVAILTPDPTVKFQRMFDAGQAAAFMQLAAWELGVGSVPASIYDSEKARAILGIPPEWHLRIALSFGFPADKRKLSDPPEKGGRKPMEAVVHWDRW